MHSMSFRRRMATGMNGNSKVKCPSACELQFRERVEMKNVAECAVNTELNSNEERAAICIKIYNVFEQNFPPRGPSVCHKFLLNIKLLFIRSGCFCANCCSIFIHSFTRAVLHMVREFVFQTRCNS